MARILLVEDNLVLSQALADGLSELGHTVEVANDGDIALVFLKTNTFDLLILDWNIPGKTGLELCGFFRKLGRTEPVLFLTSREDITDKSQAFESGADDYLTKPFHMRELELRVKALLKRPIQSINALLKIADLEINLTDGTLKRAETIIHLQPRELALLEFFLRRPGHVIKAEVLLSGVWGSEFDGSDVALRSCLAKLRKALSAVGMSDAIETVHGYGYRLKPL